MDEQEEEFSFYNFLKKQNEKLIIEWKDEKDAKKKEILEMNIGSNVSLIMKIIDNR